MYVCNGDLAVAASRHTQVSSVRLWPHSTTHVTLENAQPTSSTPHAPPAATGQTRRRSKSQTSGLKGWPVCLACAADASVRSRKHTVWLSASAELAALGASSDGLAWGRPLAQVGCVCLGGVLHRRQHRQHMLLSTHANECACPVVPCGCKSCTSFRHAMLNCSSRHPTAVDCVSHGAAS